jgi:hypothetical protein
MDSAAYSAAPWLPIPFLVLLAWFIGDSILRTRGVSSEARKASGTLSIQPKLLIALVTLGIILFLGTAAFLFCASMFFAIHLARVSREPLGPSSSLRRVLSLVAIVMLIISMSIGVWLRSQMTPFEVYERYVWSGTRISDSMSSRLAANPQFDIELLRPLLESKRWERADMALFVMEKRRKKTDLVHFGELIMERLPTAIPTGNPVERYEDFYLRRWLDNLGLQHIRTQAELAAWLAEQEESPKNSAKE